MKKLIQLILITAIISLLTGCYNATGDIRLNSNGSGTLSFTLNIMKEYYSPDTFKPAMQKNILSHNLSDEIKITRYSEKLNKEKGEYEIKSELTFRDINQLKHLELGVVFEMVQNTNMPEAERSKYPAGSYKLNIMPDAQSDSDSIVLTIYPHDKVVETNGSLKWNSVNYTFAGKANPDNYIILKPAKFNLFDVIVI